MLCDKRNIRCNELAEIFEEYLMLKNAHDYSDALLKEDTPKNVKDAHAEYKKLKKEIREDREKSPFM